LFVVAWLVWKAYKVSPRPSTTTNSLIAPAYDVFTQDMAQPGPRANPWSEFIQENVYVQRTGPIGDFSGQERGSRNAPLYMIT
jgi:hypothetical protein